jgi:hypothetical protein
MNQGFPQRLGQHIATCRFDSLGKGTGFAMQVRK